MKYIYYIILSIILCCHCTKINYIINDDITMANIVDGKIISDQQLEYQVIEDKTEGAYLKHKRVIIQSDILEKVGDKVYKIRLKDYAPVMIKPILKMKDIDNPASLDTNITILQSWFSGEYLNFALSFDIRKEQADKLHIIQLVDKSTNEKELKLLFTHSTKDRQENSSKQNIPDIIHYRFYLSTKKEFLKSDNIGLSQL